MDSTAAVISARTRNRGLRLGLYRSIYLWGGARTTCADRLIFANVSVDRAVYDEADTTVGAERVCSLSTQAGLSTTAWDIPYCLRLPVRYCCSRH